MHSLPAGQPLFPVPGMRHPQEHGKGGTGSVPKDGDDVDMEILPVLGHTKSESDALLRHTAWVKKTRPRNRIEAK